MRTRHGQTLSCNPWVQDPRLGLKRRLLDILACPIDKHYPLELHVFEEKEEITRAYSFALSVTDGIRSQMRFPKCYRTISERPRMILHGYKSGRSEFQTR